MIYWTTDDEIGHLKKIGGWRNNRKMIDPVVRRVYLEQYQIAMKDRKVWESKGELEGQVQFHTRINKEIIENYIKAELAVLEFAR